MTGRAAAAAAWAGAEHFDPGHIAVNCGYAGRAAAEH